MNYLHIAFQKNQDVYKTHETESTFFTADFLIAEQIAATVCDIGPFQNIWTVYSDLFTQD